ncbi:DUF1648 domain-containing protein [Rossellomorea vietnamensis]|jgi:Protein of unknown function (DUF1648)|uniref:DUF1648 domain-containing protein n=1 Tax=Rossellomorea vietnamensis TaxID=218284 RepID=A0A6I6UCH9_9BACI|nr:DUF1648 domain-containing protein [Rossellomorea vietnamensis]QHE60455.1 DUF1648 domain-containing protein [Rossellomorea vietnamensis]
MRKKLLTCTLIIISMAILFYHFVHLFSLWSEIPSTIPIHFNSRAPDHWGSKYLLFIMPVVGIVLWFFMGLLARRPEKLNYVHLTEENKHIQYVKAEKLMVFIQYLCLMMFEFANEAFLRNAVGMDSSLPLSIALALMAICFLAPMYHMFWAATLKH